MKHILEKEFLSICEKILSENISEEEWAEIESCDMFQTEHYVGGFEAIEMEFTFSVYIEGQEYWFQVPLKMIREIYNGSMIEVEIKKAYS